MSIRNGSKYTGSVGDYDQHTEMRQDMRKIIIVVLLTILLCLYALIAFAATRKGVYRGQTFSIYTDKSALDNHYVLSGYMGDYNDLKINDAYTYKPHSGKTCVKIKYTAAGRQGNGWAGVYWQYPSNNWRWGVNKPGYDLTGYTKLTFWARGEKGGERLVEVGVGCIRNHYSDSANAIIGPLELSDHWKQYTIDLREVDLSDISGGFHWTCSDEDMTQEGMTFYLDDIVFEK